MTRVEHLEWCKRRAREYLDHGDLTNAVTSMMSDLGKHPETKIDAALGFLGMMEAGNGNVDGVRRWIEGFN